MNDTIKIIFLTTVVPLAIIGMVFFGIFSEPKKAKVVDKFKNFSIIIDGTLFDVVNGVAEVSYPGGSATKNVVRVFGEPVLGELTGDQIEDAAVLLEHSPGGSGTFYYSALLVGVPSGLKVTNAMFLGDRIAPQTVEIHDGRVVYNFAVRKVDEPMSTPPSVGKSVWVHYDKASGEIGEWVRGFEGEADPGRMSLDMKPWVWVHTTDGQSVILEPKTVGDFSLTFDAKGQVSVDTDCNTMGGPYTEKGQEISFGDMFSTLMFCEGSRESEFGQDLRSMSAFEFTSKGELVLSQGSKKMLFR